MCAQCRCSSGVPMQAAYTHPAVTASPGWASNCSSVNSCRSRRALSWRPVSTIQVTGALDELHRSARLAGRQPVCDGSLRPAMRLVPARRPAMQPGDGPRRAAFKLCAQQLREQMVVAVPLVTIVHRRDEDVTALEVVEYVAGVGATGHGRAQRRRELVQDRRLEQESLHVGRLPAEDLTQQIGGDLALIAAEAGGEVGRRRILAGEERQSESAHPSLSETEQVVDHLLRRHRRRACAAAAPPPLS